MLRRCILAATVVTRVQRMSGGEAVELFHSIFPISFLFLISFLFP